MSCIHCGSRHHQSYQCTNKKRQASSSVATLEKDKGTESKGQKDWKEEKDGKEEKERKAPRDASPERPRISFVPQSQGRSAMLTASRSEVETGIKNVHDEIGDDLGPYSTKGAQLAFTWVRLQDGSFERHKTTENRHSEMRAITARLDAGQWILRDGRIRGADGGLIVGGTNANLDLSNPASPVLLSMTGDFFTNLPHCGYCTFMLTLLELPLCQPTAGNYGYAGHHNYDLPPLVAVCPQVIARALGHLGDELWQIKKVWNQQIRPAGSWVLRVGQHYYSDTARVQVTAIEGDTEHVTLSGECLRVFDFKDLPHIEDMWSVIWEILKEQNAIRQRAIAPQPSSSSSSSSPSSSSSSPSSEGKSSSSKSKK